MFLFLFAALARVPIKIPQILKEIEQEDQQDFLEDSQIESKDNLLFLIPWLLLNQENSIYTTNEVQDFDLLPPPGVPVYIRSIP